MRKMLLRSRTGLAGLAVAAFVTGLVAAAPGSAQAATGSAGSAGSAGSGASTPQSSSGAAFTATSAGKVRVYDASSRSVKTVSAAQGAELMTAYWTPARRAAAIPVHESISASDAARFAATASPGRAPTTLAKPVAPKQAVGTKGMRAAAVVNFSNAVGKVYFTDPSDGKGYQCSGSTVNSAKGRLVWTAGHCVHGGPGKQWMTNWVFEPGYQRGVGAPGVFPYYQLWAQSGWFANGNRKYDYGVGITWNNAQNWKVVPRVGGNGLTIYPGRPFVTAIGYPSNFLSGETQSYCQVTLFARSSSNTDQALNCNRGQGASGEPWLRDYNNANGLGWIVSDNSYSLKDDHGAPEYGPYYDNDTAALYNAAEGASPS